MFLWRSQSWDLPWAVLLEAEPGLEWRVWEQNLPQIVFSGALVSLSCCLWILCGDILSFRDTGKGQVKVPTRQTRHPLPAVRVLLRKLLFRKGKILPPLSQKGWNSLLLFCLFRGSGRPNDYLG